MIDRSTKLLLAAIALGLLANAVTPILRPAPVAAQGPTSCNGDLAPTSTSGDHVTGWSVSVKCR